MALLDDPYLLNRYFAQRSVERMIGKHLDDAVGYWYYMTPEERKSPIDILRAAYSE